MIFYISFHGSDFEDESASISFTYFDIIFDNTFKTLES
jgi:hypothetical protein